MYSHSVTTHLPDTDIVSYIIPLLDEDFDPSNSEIYNIDAAVNYDDDNEFFNLI